MRLAPALGHAAEGRTDEDAVTMRPHDTSRLESRVAAAYIVVAFVGTALVVAAVSAQVLPGFILLLWLLYLGPIGLVAAVLAASLSLSLTATSGASLLLGAVATLLCTGIACLNVLVVQGLRRRARRRLTGAGRPKHATAAAVLFAFAGAAFVVLSVLAGFLFLVAPGVEVPTPAATRIRMQTLAALGWLVGLTAAVAGLIVWVRSAGTDRRTLRWAIADLLVVLSMTALELANGSIDVG